MADTQWAPLRTLRLTKGVNSACVSSFAANRCQAGVCEWALEPARYTGRLRMKVMVANWTREIRPSRMKRGASGNVGQRRNCDPTSQPKGRDWKPSAYSWARLRSIPTNTVPDPVRRPRRHGGRFWRIMSMTWCQSTSSSYRRSDSSSSL